MANLLSGLVVFLGDGTAAQSAVALLVCFVSVLVHALALPMEPKSQNFTAIGNQVCLVLTFFVAVMLKIDTATEMPQFGVVHYEQNHQVITHGTDVMLVVVNVLPIIFPFIEYVFSIWGIDKGADVYGSAAESIRHLRSQLQRGGSSSREPTKNPLSANKVTVHSSGHMTSI
jgi:hypothetical protein